MSLRLVHPLAGPLARRAAAAAPAPIVPSSRSTATKSSQAYIARQKTDPFVASRGSFRSRAAFKLLDLAKKYRLLRSSVKTVVDLGSAPGGWSQVLTQAGRGSRTVVAVDLLDMEKVEGVHFVKGDFLDPRTRLRIRDYLLAEGGKNGHNRADLVLSDSTANFGCDGPSYGTAD
jgi:23S rRNA (uridine2552-2'-O)-methyltransferase